MGNFNQKMSKKSDDNLLKNNPERGDKILDEMYRGLFFFAFSEKTCLLSNIYKGGLKYSILKYFLIG